MSEEEEVTLEEKVLNVWDRRGANLVTSDNQGQCTNTNDLDLAMESGSKASDADPPAATEAKEEEDVVDKDREGDSSEQKSEEEEVATQPAKEVASGETDAKAQEEPADLSEKSTDTPNDEESEEDKSGMEAKDESVSTSAAEKSESADAEPAANSNDVQADPPSAEEVSLEIDDLAIREDGGGGVDDLEPLPSPSSAAGNSSLLRRLKESPPVTLSSNTAAGLRRPAVASAVVKPIPPFDTLSPELTSILEGVKAIPSGVGIEESEEEAIDKAKVLAIRVKEACQTVPALT